MVAHPWQAGTANRICFLKSRAHDVLKWQSHTEIQTMPLLLYTSTWINLMKMMLSNRNQEQRQIA